ncbi:hypothetical protein RM717_18940 [Streptomyces griseus]|uniref:ABC-2 type transport system permease protein n=1 Tax=Streptomyces stephensoniae TaxID=3375367 RepID=A0ABU2W4Z2_9ACTN|nr:hypothetical protein [Streptomyces griseus]MDT0492583.1 hypothetical protein [Streptomyces griseus]
MTTGSLWRLDRRRRIRVWCARHPWLPYDPARIRAAVAAAAVAAFLLTGVAAAGAGQLAGADRSRAGLEAAWSGLVLLSALAGFSVTAVRDALMVPDAVLLRGLPVSGLHIAAVRLLAPAGVFALGSALIVGGGVTAGAVVAGAVPATTAAGVLVLGTACALGAGLLTRACAVLLFRLALSAPPAWTAPLLTLLGGLRHLLLALAGLALVGDVRDEREPVRALLAQLSRGAELPGGTTALALLAAGGAAVLPALLCMRRTDPYAVQQAMTTPGTWRVTEPLPRRPDAALRAKDLRMLVRRGPQVWELLAGVTVFVPALAACVGSLAVLGPSARSGPLAQALVTMLVASVIATVLGLLGEVFAPVISMDTEGPAGQLLRTVPGALDRLRSVRAGMFTLAGTAVGIAVLLAARLAIDLPPSAVLALAPVALGSAAIDVTVLVVVSGNHPAPLRPEVLLPHPEPQVRAASMTATALWVSLAGPLAAGLGYIAPDVPALSVAACLLVLALAHRTGAALPRRWSGRAASDTPVTAAQAAELPEDARAQL